MASPENMSHLDSIQVGNVCKQSPEDSTAQWMFVTTETSSAELLAKSPQARVYDACKTERMSDNTYRDVDDNLLFKQRWDLVRESFRARQMTAEQYSVLSTRLKDLASQQTDTKYCPSSLQNVLSQRSKVGNANSVGCYTAANANVVTPNSTSTSRVSLVPVYFTDYSGCKQQLHARKNTAPSTVRVDVSHADTAPVTAYGANMFRRFPASNASFASQVSSANLSQPKRVNFRPILNQLSRLKESGKQTYFPERDERWRVRAQKFLEPTTYELVINGRSFAMVLNGNSVATRLVRFLTHVFKVDFYPLTGEIYFDDVFRYCIGAPPSRFYIAGDVYVVFFQGPPTKMWFDGEEIALRIDAPPQVVFLGGRKAEIRLDSNLNTATINTTVFGPLFTDSSFIITLFGQRHEVTFCPPLRDLVVDGRVYTLDATGVYPVARLEGRTYGLRFKGPDRTVVINGKLFPVPTQGVRLTAICGSLKPVWLALGGPGHELIVDDKWYEVRFGSAPKSIIVGLRTFSVLLLGTPPEVEVLGLEPHELGKHSAGNEVTVAQSTAACSLSHTESPVSNSLAENPSVRKPSFSSKDPRLKSKSRASSLSPSQPGNVTIVTEFIAVK